MELKYLDIGSEDFDELVEDIKLKNLSKNNMPKLIVGTGLSIIYGVPGMGQLAKHLDSEIKEMADADLKRMWNARREVIECKGLEAGLISLTQEETALVDTIKVLTASYILESEEKLHNKIWEANTGFSKLLSYLKGTISVNNPIIDIMTPNYDRIIEIICDKLGIGVITGFYGSVYSSFNKHLLKQPAELYNCKKNTWIRLFKPHGSINWINENGKEFLTNDYELLRQKVEFLEIVTPGSSKYKEGLTNNTFRCMREEFNELLNSKENYSLLFYGYGFNDDHFDTALNDSFQKNVLILAREVKKEIIEKAQERKNITIFYHEDNINYMIYRSNKYITKLPLWDIDNFADIFIG